MNLNKIKKAIEDYEWRLASLNGKFSGVSVKVGAIKIENDIITAKVTIREEDAEPHMRDHTFYNVEYPLGEFNEQERVV